MNFKFRKNWKLAVVGTGLFMVTVTGAVGLLAPNIWKSNWQSRMIASIGAPGRLPLPVGNPPIVFVPPEPDPGPSPSPGPGSPPSPTSSAPSLFCIPVNVSKKTSGVVTGLRILTNTSHCTGNFNGRVIDYFMTSSNYFLNGVKTHTAKFRSATFHP